MVQVAVPSAPVTPVHKAVFLDVNTTGCPTTGSDGLLNVSLADTDPTVTLGGKSWSSAQLATNVVGAGVIVKVPAVNPKV
jgi:hypothetical protein